jgi:uncharacterized protein YoxC
MDNVEEIEQEISKILRRRNSLWIDLRRNEESIEPTTQVLLMSAIAHLDEDVKDLKKKLDNRLKDKQDAEWLEFVSNAWNGGEDE